MGMVKPGPMPPFPRPGKDAGRGAGARLEGLPRLTRAQKDRIYARDRIWFLIEHPRCEVRIRKDGSIAPRRSKHPICGLRSKQIHHIRGRGKWYLVIKYWLACGDPECSHHKWINDHGKEAERLGYVERVYEKH